MKLTPLAVLSAVGVASSLLHIYRHRDNTARAYRLDALALFSWFALWWATSSSFAEQAMSDLPLHMISHIIVMFLVPIALIYSGAGSSLAQMLFTAEAFPWAPIASSRWNHPLLGFFALNGVMVFSHVPAVFNATMQSTWAMDWLMEPAFLLSGLYFFSFVVQGPQRKLRVKSRWQLLLVLGTMGEMLILAMAMSIFTKVAWYPSMSAVSAGGMNMGSGAHLTAHDFSQQQLAAAILWVCGDFWAVPCLIVIVRRIISRDGGLLVALERQSARFS
jgi:cytochrome c oxidase assembly factor CtaG